MNDVIQTERLLLRPYRDADGAAVVAFLNDFEVSRWLAVVPHPFTRCDLMLGNPDGSSRWPDLAAIEWQGQLVGAISTLTHLGYWIGRRYWRRGFIGEAARAMVGRFFRDTGQDCLQSGYFVGNVASARVLNGLGFRETSRAQVHCRARGQKLEHVNMELTRDAWEAAQCP